MANTDYSITRNDVITEALEYLGILPEGGTPSPNQITSMARTLNMLLKHWQGQGINLYLARETFLFLFDGVGTYNQLDYNGTTGLDIDRKHAYVSEYQKIAFAESSTTVVTVNESFLSGSPVADAVATDIIGIPLENGTMHWAEITAVGSSGSFSKSFTFANHALSSATAPDTTKDLIVGITYPGRPVNILTASLRHIYDDTDVPLEVLSISDYNMLPNKTTAGTPNQVFYNKETITGDLRTWPIVDDPYRVLVLWTQVPISDIESDTALISNFGIPQEYMLAISYSLAEAALVKNAPPPDQIKLIKQGAQMYRDEAFSYDTEDTLKIEPDRMR